ncbi:simple sugar transport system ATP-binding protein [Candidatus Pantoea symbiotica]|jgi:simple sugar transport system ATP-binding protein|uniref:Simple sugar transport system ATP-binding protein n=1 Tax=Candidatus Pantoea symbiotica TaxID=1884370 RepID=A0A1I3ZVP0_9GAMM|nr:MULTISPECIES: ABC transporter ATP-binding protein [Pantoea]KAJ9430154.1 ABC transporter ATP-binding protein [Pantoea sp. YR343]MRT25811.1 ATP-binding cassette domain-containing protein [Enterobacteriaceae bacterium RIT697]SFK48145.1 simple sugar transport system ATP-binding protein [Pantoea symbiotica]SFU91633.1 simple sugar transport system ATP-binding protein [Pantoea sp. YR525]
MSSPLIELDHVSKRYPNGFLALEKVCLSLFPGEIHALLGENGAGKSTLMNILYGVHEPSEGGVLMGGRQVIHRRPADAIANGIGMVHQHFKLVAPFSVAENLALVARGDRRKAFRRHADIRAFMQRYGVDLDPAAIVGHLPLALQQRVEILKALVNDTRVLLLDEPSTILTPAEITALYATLRRICASGTAVAVVTHNVDEVLANADRYTILRRGKTNGSGLTHSCTPDELVERIVGRAVSSGTRLGQHRSGGAEQMRLSNIQLRPGSGSPGLHGINLTLAAREVVGVAGVEGNGQSELFAILAGELQPEGGEVVRSSDNVTLALVPQDRHHEGLSLDLPVSHNLLYPEIMRGAYRRAGLLDHKAIAARAVEMIAQSDIRTHSHASPARSLSGGNQQKIVVARALAQDASIIVVYQPTRGLDMAAAEAVLMRLAEAADAGTTVIIISSNIEELIRVSDRIVVMNGGRITGAVAGDEMSIERIGTLMTSGRAAQLAGGLHV